MILTLSVLASISSLCLHQHPLKAQLESSSSLNDERTETHKDELFPKNTVRNSTMARKLGS